MKSTAKKLAVCAAALCLLACGTAVSAAAASPVSGLALSGVAMPWDQDVPAESIEAGSYTANMLLGSSQQLSPVVRPRNSTDSVVFISDDTSILTVSNSGVVQAVGVGTTRITAAAGNQICAYTIVVSMDSSMIVTEMDLSLSSNTIYVGNSVSAQLQVRPTSASNYATVALTSSNEKVATVNNFGRVTGISPGTATITATCGSVTATTNVTVMSIPNSSTGTASTGSSNSGQVVTVNPSYVVLKPGATRTLTASVKPSSASQKFTYKSANSNIATVSPSGVITAVGTGATSITVSNGTASAMVTVIVNRSAASSSDNSSDSSSTESDNDTPIEIDPVVQAIQDSEDNEIVFTQAEVPTVTGDILNALRTTGKTLCVVGDGYTMQIAGSGVKSTTSELDTMLILTESDQGIEFELDKGKALPCSVRIDLDVSTYTRLYLYNTVSNKWQYLNSYTDGIITADTAGRYLLTNQNLKFANINWTQVRVGPGDFIIISANPIPGNEKSVTKIVNGLLLLGAEVIYESMYDVHVSGHACQEEQKLMLTLTKPKYFLPVHGEYKQLKKHALTAASLGIPTSNILIAENGSNVILSQDEIKLGEPVTAGAVMVDGLGVGDVGNVVLRDRKHLSEDGLVIIVATVDSKTGKVLAGPDLVSRGFVYVRENESLMDGAQSIVENALDRCVDEHVRDWNSVKTRVREALSSYIYRRTKRSPMILPILMEV